MANEEHLALLKQGVDTWNTWRVGHFGEGLDLSGANLSDALLNRAYLYKGNLSDATLEGARYDSKMRCPPGFDDATLTARGAIKEISP